MVVRRSCVLDDLLIEGGQLTPTIALHGGSGLLEIAGMSMPEDTLQVYSPVFEWLEAYAQSPAKRTVMSFRYQYYNTSTSKMVLLLLQRLEALQRAGLAVEVKWYYNQGDYDMEESGLEFSQSTILPMDCIGR